KDRPFRQPLDRERCRDCLATANRPVANNRRRAGGGVLPYSVTTRMAREGDAERARRGPPAGGGPGKPAKGRLFPRLFLQTERRRYAYILTLLPNRADADDVLQEASLVMWDKFDEEHPPDDFTAWGCRIAYFKVLDFCKKRHRSRVVFSQPLLERLAETAAETAATLQLDGRRHALAGCLGKLSPRDRGLLGRRFADGAPVQSPAAQVGRS